jgi:soluble lytic murein transglycosylase-like protein
MSTLMAAGIWAASPEDAPAHLTSVVRSDARTGKLVRSVVVSARAVNERTITPSVIAPRPVPSAANAAQPDAPVPVGINQLVESIAAEQSLPPQLIHAVIKTESNYNSHAISPKGALGLMQLIPSTALRFGVSHMFDPAENIQGGARYLKYLLELYGSNYPLALAAYNAGEAAVAKYNGIPPFAETQNYVVQVKNNWEKLAAAERAKQASQPAAQPAPVAPSGPTHVKEVVDSDGTVRYVSR